MRYLTAYQFAKRVNRTQSTISEHAKLGRIKKELVEVKKKLWLIPESEVKRYLKKYGEKSL